MFPVYTLYKTEVIRRRGPRIGLEDVEYATLEWVAWLTTQRLLEPLGSLPPAEFEEQYHRTHATQAESLSVNLSSLLKTRGGSAAVNGGVFHFAVYPKKRSSMWNINRCVVTDMCQLRHTDGTTA